MDQFKIKQVKMKKAMSPLVSTVILIGFAIALGGIVMSWGKGGYTVERPIVECEQTSLSLISYGENKGICTKDGSLYFTIQNNGETDLDGIKVSLLSDEGIYSDVVNTPIRVADIVKLDLYYGGMEKIEKVIFVPKFNYLKQERLCPKDGFFIDEVGEC